MSLFKQLEAGLQDSIAYSKGELDLTTQSPPVVKQDVGGGHYLPLVCGHCVWIPPRLNESRESIDLELAEKRRQHERDCALQASDSWLLPGGATNTSPKPGV